MAISLNVDVRDREIQALINNLKGMARGGFKSALKSIGEAVKTMSVAAFEDETSPSGKEWKKSARAESEGGQTLSDTGRLKTSIDVAAGSDTVQVGTNVVYAAIHQLGGTIKPKKGKALKFGSTIVSKVTMPARPFLPDMGRPPGDLMDEMQDILMTQIRKAVS